MEHQPWVRATESVNTNLLLSGELGNLRQRQVSIPLDPTILFAGLSPKQQKRRTDASLQTAGLLTT